MADGRNLVIIVDDDQAVREALQFALRLEGLCVHVHRWWGVLSGRSRSEPSEVRHPGSPDAADGCGYARCLKTSGGQKIPTCRRSC